MQLNWNLEIIQSFIITVFIIILVLFMFREFLRKKITGYLYLAIAISWMIPYILLDGLANLTLNLFLKRFDGICVFMFTFFIVILINYSLRESISSFNLIPVCCLGFLLSYLAFQPDAVGYVMEGGTLATAWLGLYGILGNIFEVGGIGVLFFWIVMIYINSPFEIKKDSTILLITGIIGFPIQMVVYVASIVWLPELILLANVFLLLSLIIFIYVLLREPKVFYVLSFIPYRIFVKDARGRVLVSRVWAKSKITEDSVAQFLDLTKTQGSSIAETQQMVDVSIKNEYIILQRVKFITTVLIVSKSTKFLRDLVKLFSLEFEEKFAKDPNKESGELGFLEDLMEKYFSIFPSRIIDERKQPLFLSKEHFKIPSEIDEKLRQILKTEEEYTLVKCEIQRLFEKSVASEYLDLYNELLKEDDHEDDE